MLDVGFLCHVGAWDEVFALVAGWVVFGECFYPGVDELVCGGFPSSVYFVFWVGVLLEVEGGLVVCFGVVVGDVEDFVGGWVVSGVGGDCYEVAYFGEFVVGACHVVCGYGVEDLFGCVGG